MTEQQTGGAPPSAAAPDPDTAYAAALDQAMNAPTPQAKMKAVDALEALARDRDANSSADASHVQNDAHEGFEPPTSGLVYQFEQKVPPGVEIADTAALGALKTSLADAGVPPEIGNAAFGHIAELSGQGAFASEASYIDACGTCRSQLERVHGEGARSLIADAIAWIEQAVRFNPALEDAATAALASPMAIQAAANMHRFGGPGRK